MRKLVTYRPGPCLEGFTALDRLYEALAPSREADERTLFGGKLMSEQAQRLDRGDVGITLLQSFAKNLANLFVAIKKHVLLAWKVVEHGHPSDISSGCDLVHRHMLKAAL